MATQEVESILSEASDVVEQTLDLLEDQAERVITITRNNPLVVAGAFIIGAGISGVIAYKVAVKRTTLAYEDILTEQLAEAKEFYARRYKDGEFETPEGAVKALVPEEVVDAMKSYSGEKVPYNNPETVVVEKEPVVQVEEVTVTNNVFVAAQTDPRDWDYDEELKHRDPSEPYVISHEEFTDNGDSYEQASLTYYVADDTLTDDKDQPIDNVEYTVGNDNLLRFGHGSEDRNVVYIRNEKIEMDFEVVKSDKSYAQDVMGLEVEEPEIRHSSRHPNRVRNNNTPRRFRGTDD